MERFLFILPFPSLSLSFSFPLVVVFSSSLQCSTNMRSDQRFCGVKSRGQDGRVWNKRWERAAGKQSSQSNILSNSACIPGAGQWTLLGGPSALLIFPGFIMSTFMGFSDEKIMTSGRRLLSHALFYKTTLYKLKAYEKLKCVVVTDDDSGSNC